MRRGRVLPNAAGRLIWTIFLLYSPEVVSNSPFFLSGRGCQPDDIVEG